jgi:hypothetical protein
MPQSRPELVEYPQDIPPQRSSDRYRPIRETVNLLERQAAVLQVSQEDPAALGAQVEGYVAV